MVTISVSYIDREAYDAWARSRETPGGHNTVIGPGAAKASSVRHQLPIPRRPRRFVR
jgi:hypothetical protein